MAAAASTQQNKRPRSPMAEAQPAAAQQLVATEVILKCRNHLNHREIIEIIAKEIRVAFWAIQEAAAVLLIRLSKDRDFMDALAAARTSKRPLNISEYDDGVQWALTTLDRYFGSQAIESIGNIPTCTFAFAVGAQTMYIGGRGEQLMYNAPCLFGCFRPPHPVEFLLTPHPVACDAGDKSTQIMARFGAVRLCTEHTLDLLNTLGPLPPFQCEVVRMRASKLGLMFALWRLNDFTRSLCDLISLYALE